MMKLLEPLSLWLRGRIARLRRFVRWIRARRRSTNRWPTAPTARSRGVAMLVCGPCLDVQQWRSCRVPASRGSNPISTSPLMMTESRACSLCGRYARVYRLGPQFLETFPPLSGAVNREWERRGRRQPCQGRRAYSPLAEEVGAAVAHTNRSFQSFLDDLASDDWLMPGGVRGLMNHRLSWLDDVSNVQEERNTRDTTVEATQPDAPAHNAHNPFIRHTIELMGCKRRRICASLSA